ncbi:hypothetical protein AVEN_222716-1 [Araneus ventricosus]|uniref:Uncharacterized protein n=1 Tax=Araneus ventricosus TaxID=182803 RepID=A0A4Y2AYS3_ARAVE|nr:hypothetical protein AVEN_222716-1 [Araneus ventricosus]
MLGIFFVGLSSVLCANLYFGILPNCLSSLVDDLRTDTMATAGFEYDPDDLLPDAPGVTYLPDSDPSNMLQTVRDIRSKVEATNISLLELSSHDLSRLETSIIPDIAFCASGTDSKLIDHLNLLFYSDRSSVLSTELKEAWSDFKRRPCRETLFVRTCLIADVLLPDGSRLGKKSRGNRSNPTRGVLSRKKLRRIEYAKAQKFFGRNPSRHTDSLLNPTSTL